MRDLNRQIFGIALGVIGLMFLLVNNHLLWFGWGAIWPVFLMLAGVFFLKVFSTQREDMLLFLGVLFLASGVFFFLFSASILSWSALEFLWPTFPLIGGIALLAVSAVSQRATMSVVVGVAAVVFAAVSYLYTGGGIPSRISAPLVRLWPLVLIASGVLIFLRSRGEGEPQAPVAAEGSTTGDDPPSNG